MKLLSLNIWGGTQGQPLFNYLMAEAKDTDIFCFQEVFSAKEPAPLVSSEARMYMFEELEKMLPSFHGVFCQRSSGYNYHSAVEFPVSHGLAIFVKESIKIIGSRAETIGAPTDPHASLADGDTKIQILDLALANGSLSVFNYHGPALPGDKLDTPERILCSEALKALLEKSQSKAKILCGDFNLMPETQSIKILEAGMRNLIKEYAIKSTRNKISWNKYHNIQHFADYTFVSPGVEVKSFEVPYNEVSDHLPMILEFLIDAPF